MLVMQKKTPDWPLRIKAGSVIVRLYRTPNRGSDAFTLAYHEGGRRMRRMFAHLAEAKTEAKLVADRLNAGKGDALNLTGRDRDSYLHAVRSLKPLGIPLSDAIAEFIAAKKIGVPLLEAAKTYHKTHSTKLPAKTVAEVIDELTQAKRTDGASRAYLAPLKTCLNHFARDFRMQIADVQTSDIDAWLRGLKHSPRTRNNHRNAVVLLFNFAKSAGYLNRDQTTAAEHTALARKKVEPIEVFSPEEFAKLLAAAGDDILPFFVLGGFCGLRTVEISRLLWEDIRWADSSIVISAAIAKTRTRRLAPLTEPAAAWLSKFKHRAGRVLPFDKLHEKVKAVCDSKKVRVTWKDNGLRHSFITYRVATTKDFVRTAFEAGNSPQVIKANYDAVATEQEGKAWFSILPTTPGNVISMPNRKRRTA